MGKKTNDLEKLFDVWKEKQKKEWEETSGKERNKGYLRYYNRGLLSKINPAGSFTKDGIVDEERWEKGKKILFILKEANGGGQLSMEQEPQSVCIDESFWFRNCVLDRKVTRWKGIFRRIEKIAKTDTDKDIFDTLGSVAYMNINKRGGKSNAVTEVIDGYLKEYKEQILQEIKVIEPNTVAICCGNTPYARGLGEIIKKEICNIEIKYYNHPAARISDENYLKGINL